MPHRDKHIYDTRAIAHATNEENLSASVRKVIDPNFSSRITLHSNERANPPKGGDAKSPAYRASAPR